MLMNPIVIDTQQIIEIQQEFRLNLPQRCQTNTHHERTSSVLCLDTVCVTDGRPNADLELEMQQIEIARH